MQRTEHSPTEGQTGGANSRFTDAACPRWLVGDIGVDTVALLWRDREAAAALCEIARARPLDPLVGLRQRARWKEGHLLLVRPVAGIRCGGASPLPPSALNSGRCTTSSRLAVATILREMVQLEWSQSAAHRHIAALSSTPIWRLKDQVPSLGDPLGEI